MPLGRLELLRVLLGVGQRADRVAELLLHVRVDGLLAHLGAELDEPELHPLALEHVGVGRAAADLGQLGALDGVDLARKCGQAALGDRRCERGAVRLAQRLRDRAVDPLGLTGLGGELDLELAQLLDLAVGELERRDQILLGDLLRARLDHGDRLGRAAHDQVERRVLQVGQRRVDDQPAVDAADAHGAHRAQERHRREHQRRRRAVDGQDVVGVHLVGRERGHDDLDLVLVALRPQRPDRPVDHAGRQDRLLSRASLALEESARDLAGGVGLLLDVDREREEVRPLTTLGPADRGGEHHGAFLLHQDRSVRLLGDGAGLEADLLVADGGDETRRSGLNCNAHISLFLSSGPRQPRASLIPGRAPYRRRPSSLINAR